MIEFQDWRVVGTSVIGTSHVKSKTPCQDSHHAEIIEAAEQIVILVVADGAGSATKSEYGSNRACQEVVDNVRLFLEEGGRLADITREQVINWLDSAVCAIRHVAESESLPIREYACTLLAAVISPSHSVFFQVGDGAIVFWPRNDDDWCLMSWPQHGEYINTTVFLTDEAARRNVEFCSTPDVVDEIAVFTDGIEALVLHYASKTVHGSFFDMVFPAVRALPSAGISASLSARLGEYLSSAQICDRTDDDKTLLLASRIKTKPPRISAN